MTKPISAAALAFILLGQDGAPGAEHTKDTINQIEKNLSEQKAVLVDVREEDETEEGYIEGAILVPLSLLQEGAASENFGEVLAQRLPKNVIVYTYCRAGGRSLVAADLLDKYDYQVRPLKQGFADLAQAGFVTAKPKR